MSAPQGGPGLARGGHGGVRSSCLVGVRHPLIHSGGCQPSAHHVTSSHGNLQGLAHHLREQVSTPGAGLACLHASFPAHRLGRDRAETAALAGSGSERLQLSYLILHLGGGAGGRFRRLVRRHPAPWSAGCSGAGPGEPAGQPQSRAPSQL